MKSLICNTFAFIVFLFPSELHAVRETYVKSAKESRFFFVMLKSSEGICYQVSDKGNISKIWKTQGWYSYPEELFFSNDGEKLVRSLELAADKISDDAIIFNIINKGEIVKEITLSQIIDVKKVKIGQMGASKFACYLMDSDKMGIYGASELIQLIGLPSHEPIFSKDLSGTREFFYLRNSEGIHIVFDLINYEIIYKGKDHVESEAKLPWEKIGVE